jgi:hypothetical protein
MTLKADLKRLIDEHGFEAVFAVVSHADIVENVHGLLAEHGWSEVAEQLQKLKPKKVLSYDPDGDELSKRPERI